MVRLPGARRCQFPQRTVQRVRYISLTQGLFGKPEGFDVPDITVTDHVA